VKTGTDIVIVMGNSVKPAHEKEHRIKGSLAFERRLAGKSLS
jgi:hypothetical protein